MPFTKERIMHEGFLRRARRRMTFSVIICLSGVLFYRIGIFWFSYFSFVFAFILLVLALAGFFLHYSVDVHDVKVFFEKYRLRESGDYTAMMKKIRSIANDEFAPTEDREIALKLLENKIPVEIRIFRRGKK